MIHLFSLFTEIIFAAEKDFKEDDSSSTWCTEISLDDINPVQKPPRTWYTLQQSQSTSPSTTKPPNSSDEKSQLPTTEELLRENKNFRDKLESIFTGSSTSELQSSSNKTPQLPTKDQSPREFRELSDKLKSIFIGPSRTELPSSSNKTQQLPTTEELLKENEELLKRFGNILEEIKSEEDAFKQTVSKSLGLNLNYPWLVKQPSSLDDIPEARKDFPSDIGTNDQHSFDQTDDDSESSFVVIEDPNLVEGIIDEVEKTQTTE